MKKQHAEHVRLIHFLTFGFSLVLIFAFLNSLVQAAPLITPSGLNTELAYGTWRMATESAGINLWRIGWQFGDRAGDAHTPSESTEAMPVVSLRRIAPPGFLSQSFATDWSAGCVS